MSYSITPQTFQGEAHAQLSDTIQRLCQLTQRDLQAEWRWCLNDLPIEQALNASQWMTWAIAPLNARHHIAWSRGRQVLWLVQRVVVPSTIQGYPLVGLTLRLALLWWAEAAQVYVNGQLAQEGDLFDCNTRLRLSSSVTPGMTFDVAIRLVSPGHDDGALVRSQCLYEVPSEAHCPEPSFVADELAVLQAYLNTFSPGELAQVNQAIAHINWSALPDREAFERSLQAVRSQLAPFSPRLKQHQMHLLGHAHLDLAWLWPVSDTWEAAERTFKSVLELQHDFPDLIFGHSTPALYAWVQEHRPALFSAIQQQIAAGRWEVIAGLWIEPELNTVSGEAIARQVLYGQRYVKQQFGRISAIAWLPDSFGFCWQLPQILAQGGVRYFVTQKLRWNDMTQFPYAWFWWRSPDGTAIRSLNSAPIGEGIDPEKMATYAWSWQQQTGIPSTLWLPGVGDHGGGPTRDMLQTAERWRQSPFFPTLAFSSAESYLDDLSAQSPDLPVWDDELYLEFHRGCYTTHADQKRYNREGERLLYQTELFSAIGTLLTQRPFPKTEIETAWKTVLFNQFHDILPGSAIPEVFEEANREWETALHSAETLLNEALEAIAQRIALPSHPDQVPLVVFNSLNWSRSEVITVTPPYPAATGMVWSALDTDGTALPSQSSSSETVLVKVPPVPGVGYRALWLVQTPQEQLSPAPEQSILENACLQVIVDPTTGDLLSVFDTVNQREVLSGAGNQLQSFQDIGQYWDAWNIDPNYAQHPLPPSKLISMEWIEWGALRQRLRVVRQLGESTFQQDYVLDVDSPILKIENVVDWRDRHIVVKAAFPLTVTSDHVTCEIPFGAIARPTQPQTDGDCAKWEVPALQWADISQPDYGVSLLNDCKYGYDAKPDLLRLTLLRGAEWPDPQADLGIHQFTYALYPHAQDWKVAQAVRRGYELNQPMRAIVLNPIPQADLPATGQFLNLPAENLILTAFKPAEDGLSEWVLRCYECHGHVAEVSNPLLTSRSKQIESFKRVNLLEQSEPDVQSTALGPWSIGTFKLTLLETLSGLDA